MEETLTEKILANKDTVRKFAIGVLLGMSIPLGSGAIIGIGLSVSHSTA